MTWLTPMVGLIAAGIAGPVLIVLYLLKLRRREVEVSSTFLWDAVIRDMRANAPFQKLRKNILLLLQAIALALAALALAQPGFMGERDSAGLTIILLDGSASMGAVERGPSGEERTRLELAKSEAMRVVETVTSGMSIGVRRPRAMVVSFAGTPTVVCAPTSDYGELRSAVESVVVSHTTAMLAPALQLAGAHAQARASDTRVVVCSDGAFGDEDPVTAPAEVEMEFVSVGSDSVENVGIVSLRAERSYDRAEDVTVFAAVESVGGEMDSADVEFSIDGEIVAVRRAALHDNETGGGRSGAVVVRFRRSRGAVIQARVLVQDALAADDTAWVALAGAAQVRVTVVTSGNPLLGRALRATAIAPPEVLEPGAYLERARGGTLDSDVVIFEDFSPPVDALPAGSYLCFGAPPPIEGIGSDLDGGTGGEGETSAFVSWKKDHPVLRFAGLEKVRVGGVEGFVVGDQRDVIARMTSGPGIVEIDRDGRRAICVAFDPLDSNWPFDRGYVLFLATAIDYLADTARAMATVQLRPGDTISTALPAHARDIRLVGPDGSEAEATIRGGQLSYGPVRELGVYTVSWRGAGARGDTVRGGRAERWYACGTLDAGLTGLGVADSIDLADRQGGLVARAASQRVPRSMRDWLILGFLFVLMVEWYMYHRRVEL